MKVRKYLKTMEVTRLTGRSYNEILSLAKTGEIKGHKTRKGHWRFNVDSVEKYFSITIKDEDEAEVNDTSESIAKRKKETNTEYEGKLICGHTARKYLKCSKAEFEALVDQGIILAYRGHQNRWKVSKESVVNYAKQSTQSYGTRLIINAQHYEEVIQRVCTANSSIKIMTADFKRFNLKPTDNQGKDYKDGTPFIKYLMGKAIQGVSVQIISSRPSTNFMEEWKAYYQQMNNPSLFEFKFCIRNHIKAIIIDERLAYIGSANITPAGIGQGIFTPGNFEAGILTEDPEVISSLKELFSQIWDEHTCVDCHRKEKCVEEDN